MALSIFQDSFSRYLNIPSLCEIKRVLFLIKFANLLEKVSISHNGGVIFEKNNWVSGKRCGLCGIKEVKSMYRTKLEILIDKENGERWEEEEKELRRIELAEFLEEDDPRWKEWGYK